jgi:hypothetical protein
MCIKQRVQVYDILNVGEGHRDFNCETIAEIDKSSDEMEVFFNPSINYLKNEVFVKYLQTNRINVSGAFHRWLYINIILLKTLLFVKKKDLVFLHLPPLSQFFICIFNVVLRRKISFFLHGELVYLIDDHGIGKRIGAICLRYVLKEKYSGVQKFVLSQSIMAKLQEIPHLNLNENLVIVKKSTVKEEKLPEDLGEETIETNEILLTGIVSLSKGAHLINRLARNAHIRGAYHLKVEGKFAADTCASDFNKNISVHARTNYIPHVEYMKLLKSCRALLIPQLFDPSYELIYSGMLETCLKHRVPIITKRTEYLNLLERKIGKFGVLLDHEDELETYAFNTLSELNWTEFRENLSKL